MLPKPLFSFLQMLAFISTLHARPWSDEGLEGRAEAIFVSVPIDTGETFFNKGKEFMKAGKYEEAIREFKQAIRRNPFYQNAYRGLVDSFKALGRLNEAENHLKLLQRSNPKNPYPYYGLAYVYFSQDKWEAALTNFDKTLQLHPDLLDAHVRKIIILRDMGRNAEALAFAKPALLLARNKRDVPQEIAVLSAIGVIYFNLGEADSALHYFKAALPKAVQIDSKSQQSTLLNNIGAVYRSISKYTEAIDYLQQTLKIDQALNDRHGQGMTLGNIGDVYNELDDYEKALSYYEQSLALLQEAKDTKNVAITLGAIGTIYSSQGDYDKALDYTQRAIKLHKETGFKSGEATDLGNLGDIYAERGDYTKALECYSQSLAIANGIGEKYDQLLALGNIGEIHKLLDDPQKALGFLQKAQQLAHEIEDMAQEGAWLGAIGTTYLALNDTVKALSHLQRALSILNELGEKRDAATTHANIATIQTYQGKYQAASVNFEKALQLHREIGNRFGEGEAENNIGFFYTKRSDLAKALEAHNQALAIGRQLGATKMIWEAQAGLGAVLERQDKWNEALTHYRKAAEAIESMRGQLQVDKQRLSFFSGKIEVYKKLIRASYQFQQQKPNPQFFGEAFRYAESAKARALLDLLSEARIEITAGVHPNLLKRQKQILSAMAKIDDGLQQETLTDAERNALDSQLRAEEDKLEGLRVELKEKNPAYAAWKYPEPTSLTQVRSALLGKNEALLEYLLGESDSFLLVITPTKDYCFRLPPQHEIEGKAKKYAAQLSDRARIGVAGADFAGLGNRLYNDLLKPVAQVVKRGTHLIIVPDGELYYLPFEALVTQVVQDEPHYTLESFSFSYAPSASVLDFIKTQTKMHHPAAKYTLLAFGDPAFNKRAQQNLVRSPDTLSGSAADEDTLLADSERGYRFGALQHSAYEVTEIARLFLSEKATVHLGRQATEERLKAEKLEDYALIHFSSHGLVDDNNPSRSFIVLSPENDPTEDGLVYLHEIMGMHCQADLVTLSACQTARGKVIRGEGLIGLTRAFFYAGARTVVGSLWKVDDLSTANLMAKFYANMKQGKTKDEALRQAKLDMITGQNVTHRHPYFWAPFMMIGMSK